jgi:NADPH:quinone reductase-like Zn-dependent oxidoreductase
MVKSLGADEVIDYTRHDYSKDGRVYDVVFDAVGKSGYTRSARALKPGGYHVVVAPSGGMLSIFGDMIRQRWIVMTSGVKVVGGVARPAAGDLAFLKGLIEAGQLRTVIDKRYRLEHIRDAQDYAGAGHKKGHVVILVA